MMNGKKTKTMGIFSSSRKEEINQPDEMSPLEAVTHLFAAIQIADQQASFEEKESWIIIEEFETRNYNGERSEGLLNFDG